jgi:hypothetical protein
VYYDVIPGLDVRVVSGEPDVALRGGGLACEVPYDLGAVRTADLVIVSDVPDPAACPPEPLLEALHAAHAARAGRRAVLGSVRAGRRRAAG